ncbi:Uncharacterised protein [Mycobacteroides abscessus]|nr:Uncharacterised protein [Mycobacteroides abscessus]
MIVGLGAVIEHHNPSQIGKPDSCLDREIQAVRARRHQAWAGLLQHHPQLRHRCVVLQWDRDRTIHEGGQIQGDVVGTGEADGGDEVAGAHGNVAMLPLREDGRDVFQELPIGDGFKGREQPIDRAAGGGVDHRLAGPETHHRALRVTAEQRVEYLG